MLPCAPRGAPQAECAAPRRRSYLLDVSNFAFQLADVLLVVHTALGPRLEINLGEGETLAPARPLARPPCVLVAQCGQPKPSSSGTGTPWMRSAGFPFASLGFTWGPLPPPHLLAGLPACRNPGSSLCPQSPPKQKRALARGALCARTGSSRRSPVLSPTGQETQRQRQQRAGTVP